jgi:NADH-quinone oxidoreductase subunit F
MFILVLAPIFVAEGRHLESLKEKEVIPYKATIPAVSGLWSNPTVVNNVETIASVPWIVNN